MDDLHALVVRAQAGDLAAYETLVRRFQSAAIAQATAILGDRHLAEDVAQEAFTQAYFDLPQLVEPLAFPAWLRRIVFKYCDRIVRRTRAPVLSLTGVHDLRSPLPEPADTVALRELQRAVDAAIAALPEHERLVAALCYLGEYRSTEIAELLDIPPATVRKRLQTARKRLQHALGGVFAMETTTFSASGADRFAQDVIAALTAIKGGDVPALVALLARHPDLAQLRSADGRSLLGHVADWPANIVGGADLVDALVRAGAPVDTLALMMPGGETALQWAVSANDVAVAEALLRAGAAVDGVDGRPPLAQALFYHQPAAAALLVRYGAPVDFVFAAGLGRVDLLAAGITASGAFTAAAGQHHAPVANPVPAAAADPQAELREQALVYAAINGQLAAAEWLLAHGAQIDALPSGFDVRLTPLHWAVMRQQPAMVQRLLALGADPGVRDPQYQATPLGWATYHKLESLAAVLRAAGVHT